MQINPRAEEYCNEWYTYISRTASYGKLKPRPNDRIDINIFEKCFVGEARKGDSSYIKNCKICHKFARSLLQDYYFVIHNGIIDELNEDLDKFFNHLVKHK